jgi:Flp pilus assembly protein TadB
MSSLAQSIKQWLKQEHTSGTRKFLQMTVLILGGILAMLLGVGLVGIILIASPFLTVIILIFLAIYGLVNAFKH